MRTQVLRFAVVGASTTVLHLGLFTVLMALGGPDAVGAVNAQEANVVALAVATVVNTALNRAWTFGGNAGPSDHGTAAGNAGANAGARAGAGTSRRGVALRLREQTQAFGVFLLTWGATSGGLAVLTATRPDASPVVTVSALAAATATSTVVRFVAMRWWIFAAYAPASPRREHDSGDNTGAPSMESAPGDLAEAAGFEPARGFTPNPLSRRAH